CFASRDVHGLRGRYSSSVGYICAILFAGCYIAVCIFHLAWLVPGRILERTHIPCVAGYSACHGYSRPNIPFYEDGNGRSSWIGLYCVCQIERPWLFFGDCQTFCTKCIDSDYNDYRSDDRWYYYG